jgi:hypothetical protein
MNVLFTEAAWKDLEMSTAMDTHTLRPFPRLRALPETFPLEGAVRIEVEEGIPVFRATASIRARIEGLVSKERDVGLTAEETEELERYEEIDDCLSLVKRLTRDLIQSGE